MRVCMRRMRVWVCVCMYAYIYIYIYMLKYFQPFKYKFVKHSASSQHLINRIRSTTCDQLEAKPGTLWNLFVKKSVEKKFGL